jgi:hypothetical protein
MKTRRRAWAGVVLSVLLVITVAWWVRSYLPPEWYVRTDRGRLALIFCGPTHVENIEPSPTPPFRGYRASGAEILESARRDARSGTPGTCLQFAGFELIASDLEDGYFVVVVPFWALAMPLAVATAWSFVAKRRARDRSSSGRCVKCGYDLRASSGRCPECGESIARESNGVSDRVGAPDTDGAGTAIDIPPPSP